MPCDVHVDATWQSENLACVFRFADSLHPEGGDVGGVASRRFVAQGRGHGRVDAHGG